MFTVGEAITKGLRLANAGSDALAYNANLREQARLYLLEIRGRVHTYGPYWFKHGDGSVALAATFNSGPAPADFANFGTQGQVWLQGASLPLGWLDTEELEALRQTTNTSGDPTHYTLKSMADSGIPNIDVWPTPGRNVTLLLKNYQRRVPEFVDAPIAPSVAIGAGVGLTGAYSYKVVFVHPLGKTEGGQVSATVNPVNQKLNLTGISISESRSVTAREIHRNANAGVQYKLAATINDNLTTSLTGEALADGALGPDITTPANAITGLERFPADWHETVFMDGLVQMLRAARKGSPFSLFSQDWEKNIRRMWADQRPDQHVARTMPVYGALRMGVSRRPRLLT